MSTSSGLSAAVPDPDSSDGDATDRVTLLPNNVVPLRAADSEKVSVAALLDRHPAGKRVGKPTPDDPPPVSLNDAPLSIAHWPIALVLASVTGSLVVVVADSFRRGALLLAMSVLLAFFLRLVLNDGEAGLLCVRSRRLDLIVLGLLALAMMVFAIWVPAPN